MMEQYLKTVDGRVMACLYCGDGYYEANPEEVSRKLCAMVNKLKPDVVMCGPAFNYLGYGKMAANIAMILIRQQIFLHCSNVKKKMKKRLMNLKIKFILLKHQKKVGLA